MAEATVELVMKRIFAAPRELVYRAFTEPDQLAEWFGPAGFSVARETVDIDAREGGYERFVMVSEQNPTLRSPVSARFVEVVENELLVGVEDREADSGDAASPGLYLRLEFHDEDSGRTRLVLRQGPYTEDVERTARDGWESSFAKLDALLH